MEFSPPVAVMLPKSVAAVETTALAELVVIVGATVLVTLTALLKAEVTPEELKQILILSSAEYCIAVYVRMPLDTAEPDVGVEVKVPEPAVPPHVCVESTTASVTVEALSVVTVLPNWSWSFTTGFVAKSVLGAAVEDGWVVTPNLFFAPTTSVNVPKLAPLATPVFVPVFVMFPEASGVPEVGLTWMFENVTWHLVVGLPPEPSAALAVNVILPAAGVAVVDVKVKQAFDPTSLVMVAVTVCPVLNSNPLGALMMIVPLPAMSPVAPSVMVGPVSAVYEPPVLSALIVVPPVAGVIDTAASAVYGMRNAQIDTINIRTFFFMVFRSSSQWSYQQVACRL